MPPVQQSHNPTPASHKDQEPSQEFLIISNLKNQTIDFINLKTGISFFSYKNHALNLHENKSKKLMKLICLRNHQSGGSTFQSSAHSGGSRRIGNHESQFILFALHQDKPLLSCWLNLKQSMDKKLLLPELMTCITVSNSNQYLATGGKSGRLYVWNLQSGLLLKAWDAHYKEILDLEFSVDDHVLISTSGDTNAIIWAFQADILQIENQSVTPLATLSGHSLSITGTHLSHLLMEHSRYFTCSLDATVKIWAPVKGRPGTFNGGHHDSSQTQLLNTILFPRPLTCCVVDTREATLYAGDTDGVIYKTNLYPVHEHAPSNNSDQSTFHTSPVGEQRLVFTQHENRIESIKLSWDETLLVSSSLDETTIIWDTFTRSCLRVLKNVSGYILLPFLSADAFLHATPSVMSKKNSENRVLPDSLARFPCDPNLDEYVPMKAVPTISNLLDVEGEKIMEKDAVDYIFQTLIQKELQTGSVAALVKSQENQNNPGLVEKAAKKNQQESLQDKVVRLEKQNKQLMELNSSMYQKLLETINK